MSLGLNNPNPPHSKHFAADFLSLQLHSQSSLFWLIGHRGSRARGHHTLLSFCSWSQAQATLPRSNVAASQRAQHATYRREKGFPTVFSPPRGEEKPCFKFLLVQVTQSNEYLARNKLHMIQKVLLYILACTVNDMRLQPERI